MNMGTIMLSTTGGIVFKHFFKIETLLLEGQIFAEWHSQSTHSCYSYIRLTICLTLLYLILSLGHLLVIRQYSSSSRRTSALSNLFQVIWGGCRAVNKLSEWLDLEVGMWMRRDTERPWSQAFELSDALCLPPRPLHTHTTTSSFPSVKASSQSPSWNGGSMGLGCAIKQQVVVCSLRVI